MSDFADALELVLTPQETERKDALVDRTDISYQLDQENAGPFDFYVTTRIDNFYRETLPLADRATEADDILTGTAKDELFSDWPAMPRFPVARARTRHAIMGSAMPFTSKLARTI